MIRGPIFEREVAQVLSFDPSFTDFSLEVSSLQNLRKTFPKKRKNASLAYFLKEFNTEMTILIIFKAKKRLLFLDY